MALANTHLINPDATNIAKVCLRVGPVHMQEEHPPKSSVTLLSHFGNLGHRHLAHEQKRVRPEFFGKSVCSDPPRAVLPTLASWQTAPYLAPMFKYVQMSPDQLLGVVIAKYDSSVFRTALALPEPLRLLDLQNHYRILSVKVAVDDFPVKAQSQ